MTDLKVVSNLKNLDSQITTNLTLPLSAEPRKLLQTELLKLQNLYPNEFIIIGLSFAGRRVLDAHQAEKVANLLSGRRHRVYYGISYMGKLHIKFQWHKTKHFSQAEEDYVQQHWYTGFFSTHCGACFVKQVGGVNLQHAIYSVNKKLAEKLYFAR